MDIRGLYALKYKNILEIDEGYIVEMQKSNAILRRMDLTQWEVAAAACAVEYLRKNGLENIISIIRTKDGKPCILERNKVYVLMDYVEGEKLKLKTIDEGILMARTMAAFHNAGEGFVQPSGTKIKVFWGKTMEKYRVLTSKIEKYRDYLSSTSKLNSFDQYAIDVIDDFTLRAKACMKILRSEGYLKTLEKSMKKRELCINDLSSSIVGLRDREVIICKIFNIGYNMVEEDIGELINRIVKQTGDKNSLEDIIREYNCIRSLDKNSELIIRALSSYPYDSLKIIGRYLSDMDRADELCGKFKKYVELDKKTDMLEV